MFVVVKPHNTYEHEKATKGISEAVKKHKTMT